MEVRPDCPKCYQGNILVKVDVEAINVDGKDPKIIIMAKGGKYSNCRQDFSVVTLGAGEKSLVLTAE